MQIDRQSFLDVFGDGTQCGECIANRQHRLQIASMVTKKPPQIGAVIFFKREMGAGDYAGCEIPPRTVLTIA